MAYSPAANHRLSPRQRRLERHISSLGPPIDFCNNAFCHADKTASAERITLDQSLHARARSHAISSGTRWLRSNRTPDGLYPTCDLVSHYKSPLLLAEAGFAADGQTVLGWLVENYMTKSGHFHDPADAAAKSRFCDLYEDLWIAWGAARLHDEETARVTFDFCVSFLSDRHGGVSSNVSMAAGRCAQLYDLRSTALTGITALAQHRTDVAKACALFVTQLIQAQAAESSQFFIVRNEKGNLITEYPEELARIFVISADSRFQAGCPCITRAGLGRHISISTLLCNNESRIPRYREAVCHCL